MKKQIFAFLSLFFVLSCLLSAENLISQSQQFSQDPTDSKLAKTHTLEVHNWTHVPTADFDTSRDLQLIWSGTDIGTNQPAETEKLTPGQFDSRKSRGIGDGGNLRHFEVTVSRWKKDKKLEIGKFVHSIQAGPWASGHTESTRLFVRYTQDNVQLWREYTVETRDDTVMVEQLVGSVSKKDW